MTKIMRFKHQALMSFAEKWAFKKSAKNLKSQDDKRIPRQRFWFLTLFTNQAKTSF